MQNNIEIGSRVFMIESNRFITEVLVAGRRGDFYTVKLPSQGAIAVRRSRLFLTKEEAEVHLPVRPARSFRSPYYYH